MVGPAEDIAHILFERSGEKNERSVVILREICSKLSKPLEILEYIGFVSRREVSRVMKSRGRGTRYILNLCILSEYIPSGRVSSLDFSRWASGEEGAVEYHRGSELATIDLPELENKERLGILDKSVSELAKSNVYPYGLTEQMIEKLLDCQVQTVEDLIAASDQDLLEIPRFGVQTLKRIRSTVNQAVWM